jgi:hypothetical protein
LKHQIASEREREKNAGAGPTEQQSKQGGEERRRHDRVRTEVSSRRCCRGATVGLRAGGFSLSDLVVSVIWDFSRL